MKGNFSYCFGNSNVAGKACNEPTFRLSQLAIPTVGLQSKTYFIPAVFDLFVEFFDLQCSSMRLLGRALAAFVL